MMKDFLMSDFLTDVILSTFTFSLLIFLITSAIVVAVIIINEFKSDLNPTKVNMNEIYFRKTFVGYLCYLSYKTALHFTTLFGALSMIRLGIN